MSWEDLLDEGHQRVLPWYGPRRIHSAERTWTVFGDLPPEHGWYLFNTEGGRDAKLMNDEPQEANLSWIEYQLILCGYIVGDRFISDTARVDSDPDKLVEQTSRVHCVEPGLDRFTRASVVKDRGQQLVYTSTVFPLGPEPEALVAYQDRRPDINHISGVTPALDLAFRWISYQRELAEERRRELERIRAEEEARRSAQERLQKAMRDAGNPVGRRHLAVHDFEMAAREALRVSGAELLDVRDSHQRGEKVVQYRFRQRRLECCVESTTLRVTDSGVCLTDHRTGEKGDTYFTLESLPGVIGEAMDQDQLVVYRHVGDDREDDW